jgi:acyl-CoA synthetase (NDP forming)
MDITNVIANHQRQSKMPFIVVSMGGGFTTKAGEIMQLMGVPTYATGRKAALAAKGLALYGETRFGRDFGVTTTAEKP